MLEKLDHGHHVLRVYCRSLVARMYQEFTTFLRLEICINRLTKEGTRVAAMFFLFHKRRCVPLANTLFHHRPEATSRPPHKTEAAYHKADAAIQKLVDLIAA